mgnify:CR=1 FL=1
MKNLKNIGFTLLMMLSLASCKQENKEVTVEETKKEIIENNVVPEDIQENEKIWNITLELINISNSKAIALRKHLEENNIKFKLGGK